MAAFSPRQYFKNIQTPELMSKLYQAHGLNAVFPVAEDTPRSAITDMLHDFYKSLDGEIKYDVERELALVHSLSTKYSPALFRSALKAHNIAHEVTEVECVTTHDYTLFYYLTHRNIFNEVLALHDFYVGRRYFRYEAKSANLDEVVKSLPELTKEFERIANKHDRVTGCDVTHYILDGRLYVHASFEGAAKVSPRIDKETSVVDRTRTVRSLEQIHIVYFPEDNEVLIAYTGGREEKMILLDSFLRIMCDSAFEDKVESYNLAMFQKTNFTFPATCQGVALLTWKIKSIKLAFGTDNARKKIQLTLPSSQQENGMMPLTSILREFGLESWWGGFAIEQIVFSFSFVNEEKPESSVNLRWTVTANKISLCPLFPYDRRARLFVRQAGVDMGFNENSKVKEEKIG